ncbi:MAG: response regulator [Acidobacteriota bacterium]
MILQRTPAREPLRRVLVVEDDGALRSAICSVLEDAGYKVLGAGDGRDALGLLRNETRPCLILLDLMMPRMNGWELYERMQADPRLSSYPVLFLSAFPASFAPTSRFIAKPFDLTKLLKIVEEHCWEHGLPASDVSH